MTEVFGCLCDMENSYDYGFSFWSFGDIVVITLSPFRGEANRKSRIRQKGET